MGKLVCWGWSEFSESNSDVIKGFQNRLVQVSLGTRHTCVLRGGEVRGIENKYTNVVACWGHDGYGQAGFAKKSIWEKLTADHSINNVAAG